ARRCSARVIEITAIHESPPKLAWRLISFHARGGTHVGEPRAQVRRCADRHVREPLELITVVRGCTGPRCEQIDYIRKAFRQIEVTDHRALASLDTSGIEEERRERMDPGLRPKGQEGPRQ